MSVKIDSSPIIALGVVRFLSLMETNALLLCNKQLCDLLNDSPHIWDDVLGNDRKHMKLIVYNKLLLPAHDVLKFYSIRCVVRLQLFLPEMLGYSLTQPQFFDYERYFDLVLSKCIDCPATTELEQRLQDDWVVLVSTNRSSEGISFLSPYKTYWIHALVGFSNACKTVQSKLREMKLMSLNSEQFCHVNDQKTKAAQQEAHQSEMQRQFMNMEGIDFAGATRITQTGHSSVWITDNIQPPDETSYEPQLGSFRVFYLLKSKSCTSLVHLEKVAVAIHRREWPLLGKFVQLI